MKPTMKTREAVSANGKRLLFALTSPPPAKRLKQACLPFKVVTSVERNISSPQKRELSNYVETAPVEAKELFIKPQSDHSSIKKLSSPVDSYKENQFPRACIDEEPEIEIIEPCKLEADKNQRPISDYLSPSKRRSEKLRDCSVVVERIEPADFVSVCMSDEATEENKPREKKKNSPIHKYVPDHALDSSLNVSLTTDRSIEEGEAKRQTSLASAIDISSSSNFDDVPQPSTNSSGVKRVKKLKKLKKDPAIELEKERLKEERRKVQEEKEKLKAELCRLKNQKIEERLLLKQAKQQRIDEDKKKKQEALDEKERKKKEKIDLEEGMKEEKRRLEEEENRKKEKMKSAFVNFFNKKAPTRVVWHKPKNLGTFLPFQVKENMRLAPTHRNESCNTPELTKKLDLVLSGEHDSALYLEEIKSTNTAPRSSSRTWATADKEVTIIEDTDKKTPRRAKLLQFQENVRPPYWGTWCKRSAVINPRNPLKKDEGFFDYELDSNDEWADEEPGESLSHSEGEKESEDDYEVDNDLFVPHGYLSEEEVNDDDKQSFSPDTLKAQLKIKEQEFQKDRKKKCPQIKPIVFGCIWMDSDQTEMKKALEEYTAVAVGSFPIETRFSIEQQQQHRDSGNKSYANGTTPSCRVGETPKSKSSSSSTTKKTKELPSEAMPYLIRLVHGNQHACKLLCSEFQEFWRRHIEKKREQEWYGDVDCYFSYYTGPSEEAMKPAEAEGHLAKIQLERTIKKIATWGKFPEKGPLATAYAWFVYPEKRQEFSLNDLPIPNNWQYLSPPESLRKSVLNRP